MKKQNLILLSFILLSKVGFSQGPPFWNLGGNNVVLGDFLGSTNNAQVVFKTFNQNRMIIDGGTNSINSGRIAMGNALPAGFIPQARLHLHQSGGNAVTPNTPYIKFTSNNTPNGGFEIGNSAQTFGPPFGDVLLKQLEPAPIRFLLPYNNIAYTGPQPYEWLRIQDGTTIQLNPTAPNRITDGYVGLNNSNPRAHIDMVTPNFQGGEEYFFAKTDDIYDPPTSTNPAPYVQMGMMNLAAQAGFLNPGFIGNINQSAQWQSALSTVGAIPLNQDIPGNPPITRFMSARDWKINENNPAPVDAVTNVVINRKLFAWYNANNVQMYMMANGRLRIENNAFVTPGTTAPTISNNRLEITAANYDPYFNPNGNIIGNPNYGGVNFGSASGLRFTFLTSRDLVIAPNATNEIDPSKVLSVDKNGDVVAIYPSLGAACTNTAQLAGQAFTSNRAINQNNFNMEWRNGRSGFGTNNCTVGNRVEITGLTSFSATAGGNSGLRFSNLTSSTNAITNPTNKVLSVNANGDVILVTDQTGTATATAGTVVAQNGLSIVGTNTVELGGTLLHNTNID